MSSGIIVAIVIVLLLVVLFAGAPIYLGLALVGVIGCVLIDGLTGLNVLLSIPFTSTYSYMLMVASVFILLGFISSEAGISADGFLIARKWLSRIPGGLAIASIASCAVFGAVSGTAVGTASALGSITIPEMRKAGYDPKLACGAVASGGLIAILIPPSVPLVIYGVVTRTSIGALLIGGIIPGIITTCVYCIGIALLIWRKPNLAPPIHGYSWRERLSSLRYGWRVLVIFALIVGTMYAGLVTPSEAAAVGTVGAVVLLLTGNLPNKFRRLTNALASSIRTTGMVLILISATVIFNQFLAFAQIPAMAAEWATSLEIAPLGVFCIALSVYIPLGMFLDQIPMMLLTLPILHPILIEQMGFNSIWFGILVTKMGMLGMITPPVGLTCYAISAVTPDVPLTDVFRGSLFFIVMELATIGIVIAFPITCTYLPNMML